MIGVQPAGQVRRRRRGRQRPDAAARPAPGASTCSTTTRAAASCTSTSACTARSPRRPIPMPLPVGQVRMRMVGAEYGTDLRGPTVCEVIDEARDRRRGGQARARTRCAATPTRAPAWARIIKSRRPIGALLMDQAVIAGVGNVYRNELLYRHRIDPYRPGTHDRRGRIRRDVDRSGRVDEDRVAPRQDRRRPARGRPRRCRRTRPGRPRTYVYRRAGDPCRVCGTTIRTAELEGRNLFWCPTCQTADAAPASRAQQLTATISGWN